MDLEKLILRAKIIQDIRNFFIERGYLELDTPALSPVLIPETCLEVFKTELVSPNADDGTTPLYLVPSPEIYIKKIVARHRTNVFQISKFYRNCESRGRLHAPEFTMLEFYTMNASYKDSAALTEELFSRLYAENSFARQKNHGQPFLRMTMDEAFERFAGFRLSGAQETAALAARAREIGIAENALNPFDAWAWDDLYELILVHAVEPKLPRGNVFLTDYPAQVPCLAKDVPASSGQQPLWKERWELYADGMELANCYSEETNPLKIKEYFEREGGIKDKTARVPHERDSSFWEIFLSPGCPDFSGVALGVDRLVAHLTGSRSIESVLPFPL